MESKINLENLTDAQHLKMCKLCEELILGCCSNSSTFQCEGCSCEEAIQYIIDEEEDGYCKMKYKMIIK